MNSPIRQQDMCDQKPWLTPWEQVSHLKSKGVRFRYMSEAEAVEYLTKNNNYFRLSIARRRTGNGQMVRDVEMKRQATAP